MSTNISIRKAEAIERLKASIAECMTDRFRNAKGEEFKGIFSSRLPLYLRDKGWKNIPNPSRMEDFCEELGYKVSYGRSWEYKVGTWRSKSGWQRVGEYQRIIIVKGA